MSKNKAFSYKLPNLSSFDPAVFVSSNKKEQKVCDFVLTLALLYNDFSDLLRVFDLHLNNPPPGKSHICSEWGHYNGLRLHILRSIYAHLRETLYLIRGRKEILSHPIFQETISAMSQSDKKCWMELVDAALNQNFDSKDFNVFLEMIRSKMAFHYVDIHPLMDGYKSHFIDKKGGRIQDAFVSRGNVGQDRRFYFADAAIEGSLTNATKGKEALFRNKTNVYAENILRAIHSVVEKFIQNTRGAAWVNCSNYEQG